MWLILLGVLEFQIKARGEDCVSRAVLFHVYVIILLVSFILLLLARVSEEDCNIFDIKSRKTRFQSNNLIQSIV